VIRSLFVVAVGFMLFAVSVFGQVDGHYRDFPLGANLASIAALSGAPASAATTVREHPILLQDLQWRRRYSVGGGTADSVQQIAFSFFNDQLFRMVVDYDREKTEGLTDADMIEAVSTMYGATVTPIARATSGPIDQIDQESGTRIARWGDADFAAVLYRSSYASGFRLVVTSTRLTVRARTAEAEAARLDEREAPQRERARQKKEADNARAAREKARLANKATFVP